MGRRSHCKKSSLPSSKVLATFGAIVVVGALFYQNGFVIPEIIPDFEDPKCPNGYVYQITAVCIPIPSASGTGGGGGGDEIPPNVSISAPQNNQEYASGTKSIVVMGVASDNVGVSVVEVAVNNGPFVAASGTGAWQTSLINLSDGNTYTITVRAKDASANTKSASVLFKVKSPIIIECDPGFHLENGVCVPDQPEPCPSGYHREGDICVINNPGGTWVFADMHGTNMNTPVLFRNENGGTTTVSSSFITRMIDSSKNIGLNTWRLNLKMEGWYTNKANFMSHLNEVMIATDNAGIDVWIDFFQLESGASGGVGFPNYYFNGYSTAERQQWWTDFYANDLRQLPNAWDDNFAFMKTVITATKGYSNLVGYEIINEPELWQTSHYQGLGNYHTYIAGKIRAETDKPIIFTRGLTWGGFSQLTSPSSDLYLQAPKNIAGEVWYIPHNYRDPRDANWATLMNGFESLEAYWQSTSGYTNIKYAGIGEWAIQNNDFSIGSGLCSMSTSEKQNLFNLAVQDWKNRGVLHMYYQAGEGKNECVNGATASGVGNSLINPTTGALTEWGGYLKNSIAQIYN